MYSISFHQFVVALFFLGPTVALECYQCQDVRGSDNTPFYHEKCKEGKLPNDFTINCGDGAPLGGDGKPVDAHDWELLVAQGTKFSCLKVIGVNGTQDGVVKGCGLADLTGVNSCFQLDLEGGLRTTCKCHGERCNSGEIVYLPVFLFVVPFIGFIL